MSRLLGVICGRRAKWVVALAWLAVVVVAGVASTRFQAAQQNDPASYEPGSAESSRVLSAVNRISGGQQVTPAVVVFARDAGLRPTDLRAIALDRSRLNAKLPKTGVAAPAAVGARDGKAALLVFGLRVHDSNAVLATEVQQIAHVVHAAPAGLAVKVAGPAGSAYDANQIFQAINGTLLLITVSLIFVLLVLIYRSPIFWVIPLLAVGFAEITAEGIGYLLTRVGVTVTGESAAILTVLVFGAGTDYALLLVSRYREGLQRSESRHEAMREAVRRAGPVIVASGSTVILALLCLLAAEVNGTRGLGPIASVGVVVAMLSGLTLLPALLLIVGRRAFWPFIPHYRGPDADEQPGAWRTIASRVDGRHRPIALIVTAALIALCLGLPSLNTGLTSGNSFSKDVESQQGQTILAAHFPAGASEPAEVVVTDPAQVDPLRVALSLTPGVASGPLAVGPVSARRGVAVFDVTLAANPSSQRAFGLVAGLRRVARATAGTRALIGGPSAEEVDLRTAATRDKNVIVPMIVLVVFLILALLLRALVAPALLIVTVLLSYGAALGTGAYLFKHVFGYPGEDPSLELFTFLFLVALGVDYNIFLMARVREEALELGTRAGAVRALELTGPVITSAGIVLAGTFSALASLPLIGLTELGFVIAFGVLLDTFLVRTVLVPALVIEFDRRVWWPSRLSRPAGPHPGASRGGAGARIRHRRGATLAALLVAAASGGLIAVAISHGGHKGAAALTSARRGPLTLRYGAPWRRTQALAPGSFALAGAPLLLGSGHASLAAGQLAASAAVPAGVPPALLARYGQPSDRATIALAGAGARRYTWQLRNGRVLVARIIPTSAFDLAILCSAAGGDLAAGESCAGVAGLAAVNGVAVLPPGPEPQLAATLAGTLKPLGPARARLGTLDPAAGARLATAAIQTARLEQVALAGLAGLPLPARNLPAVTAFEGALHAEAGGLQALARRIGRDPAALAAARTSTVAASEQLTAAAAALVAEGFKLPPLHALGDAGVGSATAL
jgi:RND superfamily putative drug exporter